MSGHKRKREDEDSSTGWSTDVPTVGDAKRQAIASAYGTTDDMTSYYNYSAYYDPSQMYAAPYVDYSGDYASATYAAYPPASYPSYPPPSSYPPPASTAAFNPANVPRYEETVAWESQYRYDPHATAEKPKQTPLSSTASQVRTESGTGSASSRTAAALYTMGSSKRFLRKGGGETWEDPTLSDWPENDFRIFVGDLGNEVSDEVLLRAFSAYRSAAKARVVRDKKTGKTRGYGFVSFTNPLEGVRALKEMNGKYIGNRPVKLRKSTWKDRNDEERMKQLEKKEAKNKKKQNKAKKPPSAVPLVSLGS